MDLDVVVCAKNRAEMLERVLRQIIQEIPFRNLIVIYGSSKDKTEEIAKKYTKKVFWDEDKGLGAARNLGIRKAASEFVAMIDTDVVLTKDWHRRLMRHFVDPKVAAVAGTTVYGYGYLPIQHLFEYWSWKDRRGWGCTNTVFKRDSVLKVDNFDEGIRGAGEDYDLYKRLLAAGYRWVWDKEVVVYHPMNFSEFLKHLGWWASGTPFIRELKDQLRTYSLFRVYCRFGYSILKSFREGVKLSLIIDPAMLFYIPMSEFVMTTARIKELKKMLVRGL